MKLAAHLSDSGSAYALDLEDAAKTIQNLYLSGHKAEAEAAVPDALVDDVALCGPRERIRECLERWTSAGVTTLMVGGDVTALRVMAELTR